jgi:deoxyribose-phosphate aldolase
MTIDEILSRVDHTLLKVDATWDEIKEIIDDGIKYKTASVCIPASFVKRAAEYAGGKVKICTVIGFPNGYSTKEAKCFEASDAVANGADEIDMVINVGALKEERYKDVEDEIRAVKEACKGRILKVIIETCLLNRNEKAKMCDIVTAAGADFIKTSTGFSKAGATREDVVLMKKHVGPGVKVKAAGGISSIEDAAEFIALGADRLGTSRIVKILKEEGK